MPKRDTEDDYILKAGEEKNGETILKFERQFDTCDPQDIKIKVGCYLVNLSEAYVKGF